MPSVSICVVLLLSASLLGCVCGKTATSTDPVAGNLINTNTEKPKIFSKPMKEAVTGVFDDIKSWYSNSGDILVNNYSSSTVYDVSYKNIFILVALKVINKQYCYYILQEDFVCTIAKFNIYAQKKHLFNI